MNSWIEYDGNDNQIEMMGGVIDGTPMECMVGEAYPVQPINNSGEVDFGQYYDGERNGLLDAGYAPAVELNPKMLRRR